MTYVKPDPSLMTPAELADYHQRCGLPDEQSSTQGEHDVTVPVSFEERELARVRQCSKVAGEDVGTWVREAALHEADSSSDRTAVAP